MEKGGIARLLRAVRRQRRWTQRQLAAKLGISQQWLSDLERGQLMGCSLALLDRWAAALGGTLLLDVRIAGPRPLTDARHAAIQNWLAAMLRQHGWLVDIEPSFNQYGDRGRIDILAFHPNRGVLLVVEIKTELRDVQDLIGRLDVKQRIARQLATERGWEWKVVVPAIVLREDRTIRRRVADHPALFARFVLRARAARAWLRDPRGPFPSGILLFQGRDG
jgi:transcriptional regulator with XRE-family HTH domain